MNISITNNLKDKIIKLGCVVLFLVILYVILEFILSFLPFNNKNIEGYANRKSVEGFPETWSQVSGVVDGIKELNNGNEVNGWIFDSSDYISKFPAYNNDIYNRDISAKIDTNKKEYSYYSYNNRGSEEEGIKVYGDYEYKLNKNSLTFTEHEEEAKKFGGHLASVTSEGEHDFLVELCKDFVGDGHYAGSYIGGQRLKPGTGKGDDTWKWTDGTPWGGYENWASNEPDDSGNSEDVLHLSDKERGFKWNDIGATRRMSGIYKRRKLDSSDVLSSVNYIILKKTISLTKDIQYRISTLVNIGDDVLANNLHYININGKSIEKIVPAVNSSNDGFFEIQHDFTATSDSMNIELISEMTSKGTKEKPIIWKEIQLTYKECDTTKCEFKPCGSISNPAGYTGNKRDGNLELPDETIDGVSYYYKYINHTCKDDATDCYDDSTCGSCLPGKLLIDKKSHVRVGYVEPEDDTKKSYPDCDENSGSSSSSSSISTSSSSSSDSTSSSGVIGTTVDAISNVAGGGLQSVGGAASVLGGLVQSLGGGIYAVYDYETGKANVVNGGGTTIAGAENIVNGLVAAGRIPANALFGAVGVNLVGGNMDEKARISSEEASSNNSKQGLPIPYEQSIKF
tara:strand:+ start:9457 stop:11331 length:1875 start_codon:yes stop_codon:yes gene_type:complete